MICHTCTCTAGDARHPFLLTYSLEEGRLYGRPSFTIRIADSLGHTAVASDLTDDPAAALCFFRRLVENAAEPCHLADLVEDALPLCCPG